MKSLKVVLIEKEVKNAMLTVLSEKYDLQPKQVLSYGKPKTQSPMTQALIMLNDSLKAANVSYYDSDRYFKDHKQAGLIIVQDSNFAAIELQISELYEQAKQTLSIASPIEQPITAKNIFGVNSPVNNSVTVKPEIFESAKNDLKTQTIAGKVIISDSEYNRLKGLKRLNNDQKNSINIYEFLTWQ